MAPVGPTQCETRWRAVLASFDKQYETPITKNPDATKEINLIRTGLIKIGQHFLTSPQQNGNGATWNELVNKVENEKSVLCTHLDGKALFKHREMEDSLLLECDQGKEEASPHRKLRKIATLTTVSASERGRRRKNIDHYRSTKSHGQW
jgi:hypothetical protein